MVAEYHSSVLVEQVVAALAPERGRLFCDLTCGDGGYTLALLERSPHAKVAAIDQDEEALRRAQARLADYAERVVFIRGNFRDLETLLRPYGFQDLDGIMCDLGVSMLQISSPMRGFMFSADGPLDMRMSRDNPLTAADLVARLSEEELADIIYKYGEERQARRIAAEIVRARQRKPLQMTADLAAAVKKAVGGKFLIKSLARVFQSLRIYLNDELGALEAMLPQALALLKIGGRMAIVDYHSLEARVIKDFMMRESAPCTCPADLPVCVCGRKPRIRIVHRQIKPSQAEIAANPSARSARLRVFEKIRNEA